MGTRGSHLKPTWEDFLPSIPAVSPWPGPGGVATRLWGGDEEARSHAFPATGDSFTRASWELKSLRCVSGKPPQTQPRWAWWGHLCNAPAPHSLGRPRVCPRVGTACSPGGGGVSVMSGFSPVSWESPAPRLYPATLALLGPPRLTQADSVSPPIPPKLRVMLTAAEL